jgi:hypothetical protein
MHLMWSEKQEKLEMPSAKWKAPKTKEALLLCSTIICKLVKTQQSPHTLMDLTSESIIWNRELSCRILVLARPH